MNPLNSLQTGGTPWPRRRTRPSFQHLREITPLVVVAEMGELHDGVDLAAATEAVKTTHQAWRPEVAETGASE